MLWRDGPDDGRASYALTPLQRGSPAELGKWIHLGNVTVNGWVLLVLLTRLVGAMEVA